MGEREDIGAITQQHEAEMKEIRREILSISEKYSTKCLESSDLEAKVDALNKQLIDINKTVADLEARNSRLSNQLAEKIKNYKVRFH